MCWCRGTAEGVCAEVKTFVNEITPRRQMYAWKTGRAGLAPLGTVCFFHMYMHLIHATLRHIRTWGLWGGWRIGDVYGFGGIFCVRCFFFLFTKFFLYEIFIYLGCHRCGYLRVCATLVDGEGKGRGERAGARQEFSAVMGGINCSVSELFGQVSGVRVGPNRAAVRLVRYPFRNA